VLLLDLPRGLRESQELIKSNLSRNIGNLGQDIKAEENADSSSPELVREPISSLVSLVDTLTMLLEDALAFPLYFMFEMVVHCWLSMRSG